MGTRIAFMLDTLGDQRPGEDLISLDPVPVPETESKAPSEFGTQELDNDMQILSRGPVKLG